jgi:hypothetical protein
MKKYEIFFRNENIGKKDKEVWQTQIAITEKIGEANPPTSLTFVKEVNSQEQYWEFTSSNVNIAITFAKFLAGVNDLLPVKVDNYKTETGEEIRLLYEYEI